MKAIGYQPTPSAQPTLPLVRGRFRRAAGDIAVNPLHAKVGIHSIYGVAADDEGPGVKPGQVRLVLASHADAAICKVGGFPGASKLEGVTVFATEEEIEAPSAIGTQDESPKDVLVLCFQHPLVHTHEPGFGCRTALLSRGAGVREAEQGYGAQEVAAHSVANPTRLSRAAGPGLTRKGRPA